MANGAQEKGLVLNKTLKLVGQIEVLTPLLIGGSEESLSVGGAADKTFVQDPVDGYPYIPGSSLKGKLRSCLEEDTPGKIIGNEPHKCQDSGCLICTVFGPHKLASHNFGPTRLLVRDAFFSDQSKEVLKKAQQEGKPYFELKTENWTDRRTHVAGSPRTFERVPRGALFDFEFVLRLITIDGRADDPEALKGFVERGLRLVEASYLGSSGSRGYGKVKFHAEDWTEL